LKEITEGKSNIYFVEFIEVREKGGTKLVRSMGYCLPFGTA